MSTIDEEDKFVIQRGPTAYQLPASEMSTIQDEDLLMVARGSDHYKVSGADVLAQLGGGDDGVWVDDIRVLDGTNGAPNSTFGLADATGSLVTPPEGTSWDQFCRTLPNWNSTPKCSSTRSGVSMLYAGSGLDEITILLDIRNCLNKRLDINFSSYWTWTGSSGINPRPANFYSYSHDASLIALKTNFNTSSGGNACFAFKAQWLLSKNSYKALPITFRGYVGHATYQVRQHLCVNYWAIEEPSRRELITTMDIDYLRQTRD